MKDFEKLKEIVKASGKCELCTLSCNPDCALRKAKEILSETFGNDWNTLMELSKLKEYFHNKQAELFHKDTTSEEKFLQRLSRFNDLILGGAPNSIIHRAMCSVLTSFQTLKENGKLDQVKEFAKNTGIGK